MLDATRAIAVAALEYYRRKAYYQRYLSSRDFEMPPNVDLMAEIDAALLDLDAPDAACPADAVEGTGVAQVWQPLSDGDYTYQVQRGQYYLVRVEDEGRVLEAGLTDEFFATNFIRLDLAHRLCKLVDAPAPHSAKEVDDGTSA